MTFGQKLAHAAKDDPQFARSVKRLRLASWLFGIGVVLAIVLGIWAVTTNFFQSADIRTVTRKVDSDCERNPSGKACQRTKQRSDERRSLASACVLFEKVDREGRLLRTTRCGKSVASISEGGEAQNPQTGSQQPGPRGGGESVGAGRGGRDEKSEPGTPSGGEQPPASPGRGEEPIPAPASPGASDEPGRASEPLPTPGAGRGPVEQAASAVEHVGEKAGDLESDLESVAEGATCGTLLAPDCTR